MTRDRVNVAVLGPGGVGGFLAAMLAREGSTVLVLASDNASGAIAQSGLRLESRRFGDFAVSVRTASRLTDRVDACLITVKATQLRDAVDRVPANALGAALAIPFLNGIEHVDFLRAVYPPSRQASLRSAVDGLPNTVAGVSAIPGRACCCSWTPAAMTGSRVEVLI